MICNVHKRFGLAKENFFPLRISFEKAIFVLFGVLFWSIFKLNLGFNPGYSNIIHLDVGLLLTQIFDRIFVKICLWVIVIHLNVLNFRRDYKRLILAKIVVKFFWKIKGPKSKGYSLILLLRCPVKKLSKKRKFEYKNRRKPEEKETEAVSSCKHLNLSSSYDSIRLIY